MKKEVNLIDAAIITIACREPDVSEIDGVRYWKIPDPEQQLLDLLGDKTDTRLIRERIMALKKTKSEKSKLVLTKSTAKGNKFKQLSVSEKFFELINGYAPATKSKTAEAKAEPMPEANNAPSVAPKAIGTSAPALSGRDFMRNNKKLIYVAVDFENILYSEREHETRISFYRLKEYIRSFGAIRQAQIFFPLNYLDRNKSREVTHLTSTNGGGWQIVICGQSTKDKDQVDFHIAQSVRDQCFYDPDLDIWIVSRDSDFTSLVEQSKNRGLNNIRLFDPFTVPFLLGGEARTAYQKMSRTFSIVYNEIEQIGHSPNDGESSTTKLIRYAAGFVILSAGSQHYPHLDSLYQNLRSFLEKNCPGEFCSDPGIYKTIIKVFKDKGIISRVGKADDGKIIVNHDHPQLAKLAPPNFIGALAAINNNGHNHEVAVA